MLYNNAVKYDDEIEKMRAYVCLENDDSRTVREDVCLLK